jgi:lysophospholipid acyltransferase (LPLAT)-like uncharacterized protein
MKITHPWLTKSLGLFGATVIRALAATLDYRIVYADPLVDPVHPRRPRPAIYILWHEYMLLPVGVRGKGLTVLVSQHRDGELITQVLRHLKFKSIRGSTTRGGVAALRRMLNMEDRGSRMEDAQATALNNLTQRREGAKNLSGLASLRETLPSPSSILHPRSSLILTPDGPRGPRRHLAEGAIYLASRLQMPIVCMGFGFDRPWRQKSWDRFAIPRPFSRARAVISPFIDIPAELSKSEIRNPRSENMTSEFETWRRRVEQVLNQVTREAEAWAESGRRKAGEMPLLREEPAPQMAA